jgi:cytochrome c oxidase subunit 4
MAQQSNDKNHLHPHITPMSTYFKVAGALFGLTFLTVIAHHFHVQLGSFAGPIAFSIAMVKAFLVMAWFMHMKDDKILNRVIFGMGFLFLAVLFMFCAMDIATRVFEQTPL